MCACLCEDTHTTNLSNAWWWFDNLGCQKQKQKKTQKNLSGVENEIQQREREKKKEFGSHTCTEEKRKKSPSNCQ